MSVKFYIFAKCNTDGTFLFDWVGGCLGGWMVFYCCWKQVSLPLFMTDGIEVYHMYGPRKMSPLYPQARITIIPSCVLFRS